MNDYREQYEAEHLRNADLAGRVAELEAEVEELHFKLNRIKQNPLWKASKPFRSVMHFTLRQIQRLKNQGSLRGVFAKLQYKKNEKEAMAQFGTRSFPDEKRIAAERSAVFPIMPKISILVPLYNTPLSFLETF